jgi:hypothetical protein
MAENTDNTQEQVAEAITSTHNPFEQVEEAASRQFVANEVFGDPVEETAANQEDANTATTPAATPPADEQVEENDDPVSWLNEQWRAQGVKIESLDDIPYIVSEYQKLLAIKKPDYTPEEIARIKLGRETGNWGLYDEIVSIDTKTINIKNPEEAKDIMKTKFILEHPEMSRPFAEKLFEKNLSKTFSEEDSEEFIAQYLEHEAAIAKKWLEEKKASINIAEDSTVEEVKQTDDQWFAQVDKVINQIVQDKLQVTYEVEDKAVNVVIDQDELRELRDAMDSPQTWLRDNILNERGEYDHEKLAHLIIKDLHSAKVNKEFYELGRVHQEQHLLTKQRGTTMQTTATGAPRNNSDPRDGVADAFSKLTRGY